MDFCESIISFPYRGVRVNKCKSWNHGQACCAGTRIFVQEGIYDKFLEKFTEKVQQIKLGDPFGAGVDQGPQVSQVQYDVRSHQRALD
jgi:acyl-CoA reductase-like NAD-dependent aldehyde dehydrogenase